MLWRWREFAHGTRNSPFIMKSTMYKHMLLRSGIVAVIAFAWLLSASHTAGQTTTPADEAAAENQTDPAFESLKAKVQRMFRSIQAKGGVTETEKPLVTALMEEVSAYRQANPGNRKALAMEAQLAQVLEDDDRVFELFDQLMQADPSNDQLAQDWLTYFRISDNPSRADDVIERIIAIGPESDALRRIAADHLRQSMQYQRAIDFLRAIPLDPANNPDAIILLSDALFAEHQFQESLDVLKSIPAEAQAANATVKNQVSTKIPDREKYVELWAKEQELRSSETAADDLPRVEIITNKGRIEAELFENEAPNTVANFITLAEQGFYDGTAFHRVLANFMAQGGDPNSKEGATGAPGTGGPGYRIPDEHTRPDRRNHFSGSLSMAKTGEPNTAGSGFYITFEPTPWLNGQHTVFGAVTDGMDVVRQIKQDDRILEVNVLRKRDHEYTVQKIPLPGQELPAEESAENADETTADETADGATEEPADETAEETEQP